MLGLASPRGVPRRQGRGSPGGWTGGSGTTQSCEQFPSVSQRNSSIPNGKLPMVSPLHDLTIKEKGTAGPRQQRCQRGLRNARGAGGCRALSFQGDPSPRHAGPSCTGCCPALPAAAALVRSAMELGSASPSPVATWSQPLPSSSPPSSERPSVAGGGPAGTPGVVLFAQPRAGATLRAPPSVSCPEAAG